MDAGECHVAGNPGTPPGLRTLFDDAAGDTRRKVFGIYGLLLVFNVAAWLCIMILPFVFFSRPREASLIPEQPITFYYIFSNLFFIGFYYLNAYYLIPRLLAPKKLLYYISVIFLLFIFLKSALEKIISSKYQNIINSDTRI